MSNKHGHWAPVNRAKGESVDHWLRRCRDAHQAPHIEAKIARGEWLPKEEYERLTGRPGKTLSASQEIWAEVQRLRTQNGAVAPAPVQAPRCGDVLQHAAGAVLVSSVSCAASHLLRGDQRLADAAVDVAKTGVKAGCRSAVVKLVEEGFEEGLRRMAAAQAARTFGQEAAKAAAQQAGKVALKEAGKKAVKEAGTALAREAGKQVAKEAAKQVAQQTTKQVLMTTLRGNVVGTTAGLLVDQAVDTARLAVGKIDAAEYGKRSAENVGGAAGGLGGTAAGAAIGSMVCPGVGTAVGAVVGGILGSLGANWTVKKLIR